MQICHYEESYCFRFVLPTGEVDRIVELSGEKFVSGVVPRSRAYVLFDFAWDGTGALCYSCSTSVGIGTKYLLQMQGVYWCPEKIEWMHEAILDHFRASAKRLRQIFENLSQQKYSAAPAAKKSGLKLVPKLPVQ